MTQHQIEQPNDSRPLIPAAHIPHNLLSPAPATQGANTVVWETALKVVRRWWKVAFPVGCVLAIISISVLIYRFVPMYQAASWIRIEPKNAIFPETLFTIAETQLQLIRTPVVLKQVQDKRCLAGWAMIPVAVILLGLVAAYLKTVFPEIRVMGVKEIVRDQGA